MASSATSEATEIRRRGRQRLIGALALVALLVVFVPMLLDKEPNRSREGPTLAIPPKDNAPAMPVPQPAQKPLPAAPAPQPAATTPPEQPAVTASSQAPRAGF